MKKVLLVPDMHVGCINRDMTIKERFYRPKYIDYHKDNMSIRYNYCLYLCDNILENVMESKVDTVVFIGDILDTPIVSIHYFDMLNQLFKRIINQECVIHVLQGNHDYSSTKDIMRIYNTIDGLYYINKLSIINDCLYIPYYQNQNALIEEVYAQNIVKNNYDYVFSHNFVKKSSFISVNKNITFVDTDKLRFGYFFFGHEHKPEVFDNVIGIGCIHNTVETYENDLYLIENNSFQKISLQKVFYQNIISENLDDVKDIVEKIDFDDKFFAYINLETKSITKNDFKECLKDYNNVGFGKYINKKVVAEVSTDNLKKNVSSEVLFKEFFDKIPFDKKQFDKKGIIEERIGKKLF